MNTVFWNQIKQLRPLYSITFFVPIMIYALRIRRKRTSCFIRTKRWLPKKTKQTNKYTHTHTRHTTHNTQRNYELRTTNYVTTKKKKKKHQTFNFRLPQNFLKKKMQQIQSIIICSCISFKNPHILQWQPTQKIWEAFQIG